MIMLIADDDAVWVKVASRFFTASGYTVHSADTWAGARALAELHRPACILVDATLEDVPAAGFCAAIKSDAKVSGAVLIMVSGTERGGGACPADRFVLKGGPFSEIAAAVSDALQSRRRAGRQANAE